MTGRSLGLDGLEVAEQAGRHPDTRGRLRALIADTHDVFRHAVDLDGILTVHDLEADGRQPLDLADVGHLVG